MENEVDSRRRFLQQATTITWGALSLTLLPSALASEDSADGSSGGMAAGAAGKSVPVFAFLIDMEKCMGSGKCLTACRTENDVPEGYSRTWVERYVHFKDGRVQVDPIPETGYHDSGLAPINLDEVERAYYVPKLCNQCDDAPCNQVCPVHASITSPEGVELVDTERCIGCSYCVQACPYGTRFINPNTGAADKCNWCYHRIMRDEQPACVEACPTGARVFGRLDDPESEISKLLAQIPTNVLKAHLGTHPKTVYTRLPDEVI
ncbi:MAG: 4Fe-4S dicluster domain-containing protein [Planctomycetales bacterium]|nr:4Fe-4S dicluster domain-containing protein [Planctomycetales bacterium]